VAVVIATIGAATVAAHGVDLSTLSLGEWLGALGAGLTAGGAVFGTPNKSSDPVIAPADAVVNGVQAVLEAQAVANAEVEKVKQAVTSAVGVVPGMGPLAAQIINSSNFNFSDPAPTAYSQFTDLSAYQAPWNR
jgi:hypothetical protein